MFGIEVEVMRWRRISVALTWKRQCCSTKSLYNRESEFVLVCVLWVTSIESSWFKLYLFVLIS